jgi:hypothetical protein
VNEWQRFGEMIAEECRLLNELGAAALGLTDALVQNDPDAIEAAERRVEARRVLHGTAYAQRIAMQKRGFGTLTLEQVCAYAPPALRRAFYGVAHPRGDGAARAHRRGPAACGHGTNRDLSAPRRRTPA